MKSWHYGWVVVGTGALISGVGMGAMLSLPVFLQPIAADTGWSRGGIAFAMTLNFLMMGLGSFGWGSLSDRIGPRRVVLAGVVLLAAGIAWAGRATSLLEFQIAYGVLVGLAGGSFMAPLIAAVTLWFDRHRALAVSLVSAGVAVAPMTVSPLATWWIGAHGWRATQGLLAAVIVLLLLPAAWCVRLPPSPSPPAGPAPGDAPPQGATSVAGQARQALRTRHFAVLATVFFACCATHSGPIFHTISYALGCGLSAMAAVTIYSVEGAAGLAGRVLFGVLADRLGTKPVIVAGLLVQALAAGAYGLATRLGEFYAVGTIFGMAYGGVMPLYAVLVRSYFAPQVMGTVLGALMLTSSLGMALGPVLGGWSYDTFGTYGWMYLGALAVGLGAAALAMMFPPARPVPAAAAATAV